MNDPQLDYQPPPLSKTQELTDVENLKVLTLCHFILGGVTALFSCVFILYIVIGLMLAHNPNAFTPAPTTSAPSSASVPAALGFPPTMGYLFAVIGTLAVLGGWTLGGLTAYAGRCMQARRRYLYILIIAGCNCAFMMPLGTVLGVFTFIVMARPTVRALFNTRAA